MVRQVIQITYECERCHRQWPSAAVAQQCENSTPPLLTEGDVVIWRGHRGAEHSLVYDQVAQVVVRTDRGVPGHSVTYHLGKQHSVYASDLADARSGYVTLAGRIGYPGLHEERLEVVLPHDDGLLEIVRCVQAAGIGIHERIAGLYRALREVQYSRTWTRVLPLPGGQRPGQTVWRCSPAQAQMLEVLARSPTDAECLILIGGRKLTREQAARPQAGLRAAFEHNQYQWWAGLVDFDLNRAFGLLAHASEATLIAAVRAYRQRLLAGDAFYGHPETLKVLFPVDERKAQGKWPPAALAWAKAQNIAGSGATRLRRVYEAVLAAGERHTMDEQGDYLRLWPDRQVLAVLAGKGGVGKSTVTRDLAYALTAAGRRVLVVDADLYGPSQHLLFPTSEPRLRTQAGKIVPHRVDGIEVVSIGHLLGTQEALTWRGIFLEPVLHLFAEHITTDAEVVLIDMPPGTGDMLRAVSSLCPQARFLVVATAGELAIADVRRAVFALSGAERARIVGLVDNMAYRALPDGQRLPLWGDPGEVPALARECHLRFLGALPLAPAAERGPVVQTALVPPILAALDGTPTQQVDPAVIAAAADRLLAEEQARLPGVLQPRWGLDNLASFLEAPIWAAGGDPQDPRYAPTLQQELQRVWQAIGNCLLTREEAGIPDTWWADLAHTAQAGGAR